MRNILLAALLAVAVFGIPMKGKSPKPDTGPVPTPTYQLSVDPVRKVAQGMDARDRAILSSLYKEAAIAVRNDGKAKEPVIATTRNLRDFNIGILSFVWSGYAENMPGKYPNLSGAVEAAMADTLGTEVKGIDRDKAVETFEALSWAFL